MTDLSRRLAAEALGTGLLVATVAVRNLIRILKLPVWFL